MLNRFSFKKTTTNKKPEAYKNPI